MNESLSVCRSVFVANGIVLVVPVICLAVILQINFKTICSSELDVVLHGYEVLADRTLLVVAGWYSSGWAGPSGFQLFVPHHHRVCCHATTFKQYIYSHELDAVLYDCVVFTARTLLALLLDGLVEAMGFRLFVPYPSSSLMLVPSAIFTDNEKY